MFFRVFLFGCMLIFSIFLVSVACNNFSHNFLEISRSYLKHRDNRFVSINTDKFNDNIEINLSFDIPFIKVPIRKSMNMTQAALANLNPKALLFGGALVGLAVFALPAFITFFNKKVISPVIVSLNKEETMDYGSRCDMYRDITSEPSELFQQLIKIDNTLKENNIDITTCLQRIMCWTVRKSSVSVRSGTGTSWQKILDGMATNEWLRSFIKDTLLDMAVENGLNDINCGIEYNNCVINQRIVNSVIIYISRFLNGGL